MATLLVLTITNTPFMVTDEGAPFTQRLVHLQWQIREICSTKMSNVQLTLAQEVLQHSRWSLPGKMFVHDTQTKTQTNRHVNTKHKRKDAHMDKNTHDKKQFCAHSMNTSDGGRMQVPHYQAFH